MGATIWLELAVFQKIINIIVSSGQCAAWVGVCLMMSTAAHAETIAAGSTRIEVFTSAQYPVIETDAKRAGSHLQGPEITVYEIDEIQSVECDLSLNLPVEPQPSKQIALQRIQNLDEQTRSRMHASATALAKAMQYGIDRFPAIVLDNQVVVYGVTDLHAALAHYHAWRTGVEP